MADETTQTFETQAELEAFLADVPEERRADTACALIGYSRIQRHFWGEYNCGRCGQHLGDSLAGVYRQAPNVVIVGHDCDTCRANYETTDWRDRFMAPDPFADAERKPDHD